MYVCMFEVDSSNPRTRFVYQSDLVYQSDPIKDNTCLHEAGPSTSKRHD